MNKSYLKYFPTSKKKKKNKKNKTVHLQIQYMYFSLCCLVLFISLDYSGVSQQLLTLHYK